MTPRYYQPKISRTLRKPYSRCLSSPYKLSVPVPCTCTCTFLRVTAGSKRTSVQRTSVPSVETLPAETRRKPVPACTGYLYFVPVLVPLPGTCTSYVPRTCTCTYTSYPYLYAVPRTCTCTCTSYLLYLYLVRIPISSNTVSPILRVPVPVPPRIGFS